MGTKIFILRYKGFESTVWIEWEDNCYCGKIDNLKTDVVTWETDKSLDIADAKQQYKEAVDDYLEACVELDCKKIEKTYDVRYREKVEICRW